MLRAAQPNASRSFISLNPSLDPHSQPLIRPDDTKQTAPFAKPGKAELFWCGRFRNRPGVENQVVDFPPALYVLAPSLGPSNTTNANVYQGGSIQLVNLQATWRG